MRNLISVALLVIATACSARSAPDGAATNLESHPESTSAACGGKGETCCPGHRACMSGSGIGEWLICDWGSDTCVSCGEEGESCCYRMPVQCDTGMTCGADGTCEAPPPPPPPPPPLCGGQGQACCAGGQCPSAGAGPLGWLTCDSTDTCVSCGQQGELCCDGMPTQCDIGMTCSDGNCAPGD